MAEQYLGKINLNCLAVEKPVEVNWGRNALGESAIEDC